jgi:hypothetical protein
MRARHESILAIVIVLFSVLSGTQAQTSADELYNFLELPPSQATLTLNIGAQELATRLSNQTGFVSTAGQSTCVRIVSAASGIRLTPSPNQPGIAFLPTGVCPQGGCIRMTRCCGNIVTSTGGVVTSTIPCYQWTSCTSTTGSLNCINLLNCATITQGIAIGAPSLQIADLSRFLDNQLIISVPSPVPCYQVQSLPTGSCTQGNTFKLLSSGVGVRPVNCPGSNNCVQLQKCCASAAVKCYAMSKCCGSVEGAPCYRFTSCGGVIIDSFQTP